MSNIFVLLFLASIPTFIAGVIKPSLFSKFRILTRKQAGLSFGGILVLLFFLIGITAPNSTNPSSLTGSQIPSLQTPIKKLSGDQIVISPVLTKKPTPTSTPTPTPILSPTPTSIPTQDIAPTYIYYTQPTTVPTNPSSSGLSNNNYYTNSDGNQVHSPADSTNGSVPVGATAQCHDGTYSFSQHHSGTCSGHGGVLQWL